MKRALALAAAIAIAGVLMWFGRNRTTPVPEAAAQAVATPTQAHEPPKQEAAEPPTTDAAKPAVAPRPAGLPPVSPSPDRQDFKKLAKETWDLIPLKSTLQARSSAELHTTPMELVNTGEQIGRIEEALEADPALAPLGLRFFANCTRNDDFPTSVRALCLDRLRRFGARQGLKEEDLVDSEIPPQVSSLADQLGDTAN